MATMKVVQSGAFTLERHLELQAASMPSMPTMSRAPMPRSSMPPVKVSSPPMRAKKFSTKTRKKMAKKGTAEPDGSYPINSLKDVSNAVKDWYRSHGSPADKSHIQKRAKALGVDNPFKK